jgi:hypothetical protein
MSYPLSIIERGTRGELRKTKRKNNSGLFHKVYNEILDTE